MIVQASPSRLIPFATQPVHDQPQRGRIENLIATEPEEVDGEFTGSVAGVPSFREGKVTRLMSWMAEHGISWDALEETWFYSDSLNDLPLLSLVSHPVAVDPDETLKEHALKHDWRVISLR